MHSSRPCKGYLRSSADTKTPDRPQSLSGEPGGGVWFLFFHRAGTHAEDRITRTKAEDAGQ